MLYLRPRDVSDSAALSFCPTSELQLFSQVCGGRRFGVEKAFSRLPSAVWKEDRWHIAAKLLTTELWEAVVDRLVILEGQNMSISGCRFLQHALGSSKVKPVLLGYNKGTLVQNMSN